MYLNVNYTVKLLIDQHGWSITDGHVVKIDAHLGDVAADYIFFVHKKTKLNKLLILTSTTNFRHLWCWCRNSNASQGVRHVDVSGIIEYSTQFYYTNLPPFDWLLSGDSFLTTWLCAGSNVTTVIGSPPYHFSAVYINPTEVWPLNTKTFKTFFKVILYSYLILKKMSERITDS